jgi:calcium-dependent protein kinase
MNILKNLDHPNIVKLYDLYQDTTSYYLVTEYLSGGELFDRIKKMSYFSERKAADYIRQILMAVVYCHDQKIVHRDLKPENILFISDHPDSKLKVIDFGTSRKFESDKVMTKRLGTVCIFPPYLALLHRPRGTHLQIQREVRRLVLRRHPVHPALWLPTLHGS